MTDVPLGVIPGVFFYVCVHTLTAYQSVEAAIFDEKSLGSNSVVAPENVAI